MARGVLALVLVAVVVACAKKEEVPATQPVVAAGAEGANCYSTPCNPGLECNPKGWACAKPDHPEVVAAKAEVAARERTLLAQSGVPAPTQAEQPPAPAPTPATAAAGAVRVVRTTNDARTSWGFAACRSDERLIGGSCSGSAPGSPSGESANDTIGARWNCGWTHPGVSPQRIDSVALCQRL